MTKASSRIPTLLQRLWHLPESIQWMDPLPPFHRRGIIIAVLVVLLAFLWPPVESRQPLPHRSTGNGISLQATLHDATPDRQQPDAADSETRAGWQNYTIASGQTLAQLFRDNNLPVGDVFAMAQVEGSGKPLSNLYAGQRIRLRKDARGIITGLAVETGKGQALFVRQPDGTFLRAQ